MLDMPKLFCLLLRSCRELKPFVFNGWVQVVKYDLIKKVQTVNQREKWAGGCSESESSVLVRNFSRTKT